MDAVRAFNNELSSLYEGKPPVSRAKMAQITKCAIKAIKFYKHVVQSVEKFIQKCKPEYKVPGLYVIDSIVRQSRHQFGPEKDVFSPRFTKNIVATFINLFKCPVEERSRVVRVLNLWQKNSVFPMEVIQPLLDLAADPDNPNLISSAQRSVDSVVNTSQKVSLPGAQPSTNGGDTNSVQILQQTEMLSTITKLLQQAQEGTITNKAPESQLQQLQHLQQQLVMQTERIAKPQQQSPPPIDGNLLAQIQMLTSQLLNKTGEGGTNSIEDRSKLNAINNKQNLLEKQNFVNTHNSVEPLFNKKLLDFDYGDSDEEEDREEHHHPHHHPPHQQQATPPVIQQILPPMMPDQNLIQQIQQMSQQQEQLQSEIGAQDQLRRRLLEQQQQQFDRELEQESHMGNQPPHGYNQEQETRPDVDQDERGSRENHDRGDYRRHRESRERSKSPRRRSRRSRSRSRDRERRRRSRSRDRRRRSRSRERERRERERERRKLGLPPIKDNNISICSTTLWFGRLTKHTTEDELREHIEKYGTIRTINMIPPRGCAFVCLTKRKDAFKVLDRLKGVKINGNAIKVAWAPGIGVKESAFKDSWDVDLGVTYIPWGKLPNDVAPLLAGGMVDEDSLPERLKGMKTGEEDDAPQPQQDPSIEAGGGSEEDKMIQLQQQPPQVPMGMPGPPPGFHLPGQNPLNLMGPGGPLSLLSGPPPPIGMAPGMGPPHGLGGPNAIVGPNSMNPLSNMGPLNIAGLRGPGPSLPGVRPGQMSLGPQGSRMGGPGVGPNPGMDLSSLGHVNSPGPRGPFGQFGNMPRFPPMQNPGAMRPPFNTESTGGDQSGMGDSDMRAMAEPKEWPPDDEVNAEDESDEDHPMDSDERILPMGRQQPQHPQGPGIPNIRGLGNPFGLRGPPMMPGQGPPNPMLGIPRAPSPSTGMPPLISLHMIPPPQQQPVIAVPGGPPKGFALPPGAVRLSMPAVGVRQGLMPTATSPHLLPPSTVAPLPVAVSVNGTVVVTRPGLPSNVPVSFGGADSPAASSDIPLPEEDKMGPHAPGQMPMMQIHGGNRPPGGPVLSRGFAPMTIRPRGGAGLLGVRPGAQGGGGFPRFGGPRPLIGPAFGGMDRPPFGNRFVMPLRPPVEFLDQDEREDRDERRPLPRLDVDDQPELGDGIDQNLPKDIDERRDSNEQKGRNQDVDLRQDIDERSKAVRASGRPSRWCNADRNNETTKSSDGQDVDSRQTNGASGGQVTESVAPSILEGAPAALAVQPDVGALSADPLTPVTSKADPVGISVNVSLAEKNDGAGMVSQAISGGGDAIQPSRLEDASENFGS